MWDILNFLKICKSWVWAQIRRSKLLLWGWIRFQNYFFLNNHLDFNILGSFILRSVPAILSVFVLYMLALAGWNSARYMKLTGLYICTVLYCLPRLVEYRPGAWNELDCIVILMLKFVYGTVKFKTSKGISSFHFWKVACQIHIGSLLAGLVANYSGRW